MTVYGKNTGAGVTTANCVRWVVDTFIRESQRSYRWRAKRLLGLSSVEEAYTGTVTVIQRFAGTARRPMCPFAMVPGFPSGPDREETAAELSSR
jgi:hypothetical protein